MFLRVIGLFFLTGLCFVTAVASSDEAPSWLQQAAAIKVPTYDREVPAVVLQNDRAVTVGQDGQVTTITTYAVRILAREGRGYARAFESYLADSGKVRELRAWLIRPNGSVKKYDKDYVVDRLNDPNDLYDEIRIKLIDGSNDVEAGAVFGYQAISEERPLFTHLGFKV